MSNRRHSRQHRRRMPDPAIQAFGMLSAVRRGCECEPNFYVERGALGISKLTFVHVEHDEDCPALKARNR